MLNTQRRIRRLVFSVIEFYDSLYVDHLRRLLFIFNPFNSRPRVSAVRDPGGPGLEAAGGLVPILRRRGLPEPGEEVGKDKLKEAVPLDRTEDLNPRIFGLVLT